MPVPIPQHNARRSPIIRKDLHRRRAGHAAGRAAAPVDERGQRGGASDRVGDRAGGRAERLFPCGDRPDPVGAAVPDALEPRVRLLGAEPGRRRSKVVPQRQPDRPPYLRALDRRHLPHRPQRPDPAVLRRLRAPRRCFHCLHQRPERPHRPADLKHQRPEWRRLLPGTLPLHREPAQWSHHRRPRQWQWPVRRR